MASPEDLQAATLRALEAGGIPPTATQRLTEQAAKQGTPEHFFTSNLSTNELLLTHECGFEPLGQVMGCCVYHVGWQSLASGWGGYSNWSRMSQELGVLTQANYDARHLCFSRLQQEASLLKADGVVGVRLEMARVEQSMIEFKAVGTAVRATLPIGAPKAPPRPPGMQPFLSDLSGQDHWALRQAGMRPVGFVFGNCSWYQVAGWRNQMLTQGSWSNSELTDFTQGVYTAREIALERLSEEARRVGGIGVVGMTVEPHFEPIEYEMNNMRYEDLLVQFTILGTAIACEIGSPVKFSAGLVVTLSDKQT